MAPSRWDDEDDESTPPSSPPPQITRRGKFDDEEDEDDVLESWDAADDSETEREKAKKEAEEKAAAEAKAKASHKSKSQRIEEHRMEKMRARQREEEMESDSEEDEEDRRARLLREQKESDMKHAEDLFGGIGISDKRAQAPKAVTLKDPNDPSKTIELSSLKVFDPQSREQFVQLRETVAPLISQNSKKAQFPSFMNDFTRDIVKDMTSDQIKKLSSALTAVANEKLKEEKAADKGGKKSKAAKTKTTLNASRDTALKADTNAYDDDGLDDGDFM